MSVMEPEQPDDNLWWADWLCKNLFNVVNWPSASLLSFGADLLTADVLFYISVLYSPAQFIAKHLHGATVII
jgi:hypothetical protein